jgi:hypothetical protein
MPLLVQAAKRSPAATRRKKKMITVAPVHCHGCQAFTTEPPPAPSSRPIPGQDVEPD